MDLASKDLEDWGKISLRGTVEIHGSDFYLPRIVYLSVSMKDGSTELLRHCGSESLHPFVVFPRVDPRCLISPQTLPLVPFS
jgi:hypothetical protein